MLFGYCERGVGCCSVTINVHPLYLIGVNHDHTPAPIYIYTAHLRIALIRVVSSGLKSVRGRGRGRVKVRVRVKVWVRGRGRVRVGGFH
jgi:hypothetical protein